MVIRLGIVYGCFRATTAELNSYNKNHIALKVENIYYLALCRKSLLTIALEYIKNDQLEERNQY